MPDIKHAHSIQYDRRTQQVDMAGGRKADPFTLKQIKRAHELGYARLEDASGWGQYNRIAVIDPPDGITMPEPELDAAQGAWLVEFRDG